MWIGLLRRSTREEFHLQCKRALQPAVLIQALVVNVVILEFQLLQTVGLHTLRNVNRYEFRVGTI